MRYFEIYAWTECPWCKDARDLLVEKGEQFMFCCLDQSDSLLAFLKKKYDWTTVPMIIERNTESNEERFIGGFTDLKKYLEGE
mgnify:CR=1 FL=1